MKKLDLFKDAEEISKDQQTQIKAGDESRTLDHGDSYILDTGDSFMEDIGDSVMFDYGDSSGNDYDPK